MTTGHTYVGLFWVCLWGSLTSGSSVSAISAFTSSVQKAKCCPCLLTKQSTCNILCPHKAEQCFSFKKLAYPSVENLSMSWMHHHLQIDGMSRCNTMECWWNAMQFVFTKVIWIATYFCKVKWRTSADAEGILCGLLMSVIFFSSSSSGSCISFITSGRRGCRWKSR